MDRGDFVALKLLGAGCILLSCIGFVLSKEREFAEHKRQLDELAFFLTLLQNEICRLRFPLSVVLEHCAANVGHPYRELCEHVQEKLIRQDSGDVSAIWRTQTEADRNLFLLDDAQLQLLSEIGEVLRMDHVELKVELFAAYQKRLAGLTKDYELSLVSRRRLNRYGTMLAGIFVIILLL